MKFKNLKIAYNPTTATNSSTPRLSKHTLNKAIDLIGIDFVKAEQVIFALPAKFPTFHIKFKMEYMSTWDRFNTVALLFKPTPNLRRLKEQDMSKKEIEIQKALGTLPYKEWMKLKGIIFDDSDMNNDRQLTKDMMWWYFPMSKGKIIRKDNDKAKTITINSIEYYPVADGYIEDLYHSMAWNKWTEEHFADEIISQCYACMSMENIDL